jgi:hypothetical protein
MQCRALRRNWATSPASHLVRRASLLVFLLLTLLSECCFAGVALAQRSVTPASELLLERMTGEWVMQGTISNEPVTHDVSVDRILNRQYVRIHEVARERNAAEEPAYEAWIHIAWDGAKEEYVVMWLDNTATTNFSSDGVGHATPDGTRIPFIWRLADGSGIHNTFVYEQASDTWTWAIDNIDQSGKVSRFARVTLRRK